MSVQGPGGVGGPGDASIYEKQMQEATKVFKEGFEGMQNAKFPAQRQEFEKSTNESMKAIQDLANALMNKEISKLKDKLQNDYQDYLNDPSKENSAKVEKDIGDIQGETR